MRRIILICVALAVIAIVAWPYVNPYSRYYRLTVDLADRQGRPVGFDIVVGCSLRYSFAIGGGSSVDPKGMSANVFAQAIPDGHALSVLTVPTPDGDVEGDPCQGYTTLPADYRPVGTRKQQKRAFPFIPREWVPLVIWYDRADDLSHGTGYYTRYAYDSPASKLRFRGAMVRKASVAEFWAFRAKGPVNLVPSYLADSLIGGVNFPRLKPEDITPEMRRDPRTAWRRTWWLTCRGMQRWPVPPDMVEAVRALWPADRPRFWRFPSEHIVSVVQQSGAPRDEFLLGRLMRRVNSDSDHRWVDRFGGRKDGGRIVLPTVSDDGLSRLTPDTYRDGTYYTDTSTADIGADDGFVACDRPGSAALFAAVTDGRDRPLTHRHECRIDGVPVAGAYNDCDAQTFIENDSYIYRPLQTISD